MIVDGAIHNAAGPWLYEECVGLNGCKTGFTKITRGDQDRFSYLTFLGYNLPARNILHTVGPIGRKEGQLQSCYQTCLEVLTDNNLRSVVRKPLTTPFNDL